ncbi:hypothetical protein BKA62DRAFT_832841 [Auriculariales sp. MPI-PUGE-AT-0066]|nr:hypothetical protein BKA62DRAFT_832841 [Auriculariales sp. MPI-PUGE-AT-0066]
MGVNPETIPIIAPLEFNPTAAFGPWFAGCATDILLMGVIIALAVEYWKVYAPDDRRRVKTLVATSMILSFLKSISVSATVWHKVIWGWGNYRAALTSTPWYAAIDPLFNTGISLIAQVFFLFRLRALLKGRIWTAALGLIVAFMILECVGHVIICVEIFYHDSWGSVRIYEEAEIVGMTGMIGTDVLLTISLCYTLLRSKTGVARTDSLITKLILLTLTTALLPTVADSIKIGIYLSLLGRTSSWITFSIIQSKLYTLSMLITLTVRNMLRKSEVVILPTSFELRDTVPSTRVKPTSNTGGNVTSAPRRSGGHSSSKVLACSSRVGHLWDHADLQEPYG